MNDVNLSDAALPFRPISLLDFNRYAKDLGWLIQESHQKSQNLLAKFYGYSGFHEVKKVLANDDGTTPGPFDYECMGAATLRANRLLKILGEHRGGGLEALSKRDWEARDIGLFVDPEEHRFLFRKVKGKHLVITSAEAHGEELSVTDYADIDLREDGECFLVFTELGRSIFDAVESLLPDPYRATTESIEVGEREITRIIDRHPNNPWPPAMLISMLAGYGWQGTWNSFWNSSKAPFDSDEGYREHAPHFAASYYPKAKRAIALFEAMYGGYAMQAPDPKLITGQYLYGADCFYWPAILYWGGRIALNSGHYNKAYTWLSKCHKLDPSGSFGTRYELAALRLERGKGSIKSLFPKRGGGEPYLSAVSSLARAAEAHSKGSPELAKSHFADALCQSWSVSEPFAGRDPALSRLPVPSNTRTPAAVQEFMYRTVAFWESHTETMAFFKSIATDDGVRASLRKCYLTEAQLPSSVNDGGQDVWRVRGDFYAYPNGKFEQLKAELRASVMVVHTE